jgi:hypothetical protein
MPEILSCFPVHPIDAQKKRSAVGGALLSRAKVALLNFYKVRIARADDSLRVYKAIHVNCHPAAIHKHEIRVPDQPEMVGPISLDKELLRMAAKTEQFTMTRLELLHVRVRRARTRASLIRVYSLPTLDVRLAMHVCAGFRFRLRFARFLRIYLFSFRRRSSLRLIRLPLRLLRLRVLA